MRRGRAVVPHACHIGNHGPGRPAVTGDDRSPLALTPRGGRWPVRAPARGGRHACCLDHPGETLGDDDIASKRRVLWRAIAAWALAWPRRAIRSLVVAPVCAARVPAATRGRHNRGSVGRRAAPDGWQAARSVPEIAGFDRYAGRRGEHEGVLPPAREAPAVAVQLSGDRCGQGDQPASGSALGCALDDLPGGEAQPLPQTVARDGARHPRVLYDTGPSRSGRRRQPGA